MLTRKIQRAMWKRDPTRGSWRSWCKRMGLARGKEKRVDTPGRWHYFLPSTGKPFRDVSRKA